MEESLKDYLNRKMRETVTPSEVMNRVCLLFPGAVLDKDNEGQAIIYTGMKIIGEGVTERFVPHEVPETVVDEEGKPPKP